MMATGRGWLDIRVCFAIVVGDAQCVDRDDYGEQRHIHVGIIDCGWGQLMEAVIKWIRDALVGLSWRMFFYKYIASGRRREESYCSRRKARDH